MKEPARPATVPAEAVWHANDKEWQLGEFISKGRKKLPHGVWKYWAATGYLISVAEFDQGELDNVLERYHPDGTLASRGEFKKGRHHGRFVHIRSNSESPESYPGDYRTWRFEYNAHASWEQKNPQWFLQNGVECTSDGRPLSEAYDLAPIFDEVYPLDYLERHAAKVYEAFNGRQPEELQDPFNLKELWGITVPELNHFAARTFEGADFYSISSARTFEDNLWRTLIAYQWGNRFEELGSIFMAAVKIGGFGDCDGIYATINQPLREEPRPNAVYLWSHETYYIDDVLSLSLDDFAYAMAVSAAAHAQRLSPAQSRRHWKKVAPRVQLNLCDMLDIDPDNDIELDDAEESGSESEQADARVDADADSEGPGDLDPKNKIRGMFWRAYWIILLLQSDSERDWDEVRKCFYHNFNPALDDATTDIRIETGKRLPQSAIYLLWRFFFFKQHDRLERCFSAYRHHEARIVRDLVTFLEDVLAGETRVGEIADLLDVREQFLKLDLLPEGKSARDEKTASLAANARASADSDAEVAAELSQHDIEGFVSFAWSKVNDEISIQAIEKLARTMGGFELQWRVFDWVSAREYERSGLNDITEARALGEWLATVQNNLLQPFLIAKLNFGDFSAVAHLLLPLARAGVLCRQAKEALFARLSMQEKYNHKREVALRVLTAMKADDLLPGVVALIDEFHAAMKGVSGDELRLATIPWEDLLLACAECVGELSISSTEWSQELADKMYGLLRFAFQNYNYNLASTLLNSLLKRGETDLLLPYISKLLRGGNDDPHFCTALKCLEYLAPRVHFDTLSKFLEFGLVNPREYSNSVTLLHFRCLVAFAKMDGDEDVAQSLVLQGYEAAQQLDCYGADSWLEWYRIKCETVGLFSFLDLAEIENYLYHEDRDVRGAAESAFSLRRAEIPPRKEVTWISVWEAASVRATSHRSVMSILTHPETVHKSPAASWLRDNPSEIVAAELASFVEHALARTEPPGSGDKISNELSWTLRALCSHAKFEPARIVVERLLRSDQSFVVDALIEEVDSLPVTLAPALIAIAKDQTDWKRYRIARWALTVSSDPSFAIALQGEKLSERKLKSWAKV